MIRAFLWFAQQTSELNGNVEIWAIFPSSFLAKPLWAWNWGVISLTQPDPKIKWLSVQVRPLQKCRNISPLPPPPVPFSLPALPALQAEQLIHCSLSSFESAWIKSTCKSWLPAKFLMFATWTVRTLWFLRQHGFVFSLGFSCWSAAFWIYPSLALVL